MSESAVHTAIARTRATGERSRPPVDTDSVRAALAEVADPELPVVSLVDLGMVDGVEIGPTGIHVSLLPTFVGCPALDVIRRRVEERLAAFGRPVDVRFEYRIPWTSDRITRQGRERLRTAGIAPPDPARADEPLLVQLQAPVPCPNCGSRRTVLENVFGPSQCRAIYHCTACRQPFERFKPI